MNIDHNRSLRLSNRARIERALPSDFHKHQNYSLMRSGKPDSITTRSPFSKLTSSIDSGTPVQRLRLQGQRSLGSSKDTLEGEATGTAASEFERLPASLGSSSFSSSRLSSQKDDHARASVIASRPQNVTENDSFFCKTESGDFGEDVAQIPDNHVYSSAISQRFHQSFKKEADIFPVQTFSHSETTPTLEDCFSASVPEKISNRAARRSNVSRDGDDTKHSMLFLSRGPETAQQASHSRDSSIAPSTKDQNGDDLSTLLIRGATDLRNTGMALEEKTRALECAREELKAVVEEKGNLSRQLMLAKSKARDGLESHAKKLEKMKEDLQCLVGQSQEFFALARQTKASMADVMELKDVVKKSTDKLVTSMDPDGVYAPTQVWRSALREIREDISNKQRVIDMLRDRLELAQGDLAESKNRIMELEGIQAQNNSALQSSSQQLESSGRKIIELTSLLKDQQLENSVILTKNAELEDKSSALTKRNSEVERQLSSKEAEMASLVALQKEHEALHQLLADREEQIMLLNDAKDRAAKAEELLKDRDLRLVSLEASTEAKDNTIETLKKRPSLLLAESGVTKQDSLIETLKRELEICRTQLKSEHEIRAKLQGEKSATATREEALAFEANKFKNDLDEIKNELYRSHTRCEMLQERFEEQTVMLQMEKKAHGDVQERLLSAEATFSEIINKLTRDSECQTEELKAQKRKLEDTLADRQSELSTKTQEFMMKLSNLEAGYVQKIREIEEKLVAKTQEAEISSREAGELRAGVASLHRQLETLRFDRENLQTELSQAREPSEAHAKELLHLRHGIELLQKANEEHTRRASTILSRYEKGDLSNEEKKLVDTAHKACQAAHEQQLVMTRNEIRQRDNLIKTLEKRKSDLESQLARILNAQASTKAARPEAEESGVSLIDIDGWVSSQVSMSPIGKNGLSPEQAGDYLPRMNEAGGGNFHDKGCTPLAGSYKINISPPKAIPFAKLSQQATDLDVEDVFSEAAITKATATKRKRAPDAVTADEFEITGPPRRTRTGTRSKSTTNKTEDSIHFPKVKARKRR